jgi:hypothetical protein
MKRLDFDELLAECRAAGVPAPPQGNFIDPGNLAQGGRVADLPGEKNPLGAASDILMSPIENSGARKTDDPTRDGGDASPRRPSREVGRLGEPSPPMMVSPAFPSRQDVCACCARIRVVMRRPGRCSLTEIRRGRELIFFPRFRKMLYDPQQPMPALDVALLCGLPPRDFRISPQPDMSAPK